MSPNNATCRILLNVNRIYTYISLLAIKSTLIFTASDLTKKTDAN